MKRIFLGIWVFVITICLSSCSILFNGKEAYYRDEFVVALRTSDVQAMYRLFSQNVRDLKPELLDDICELFRFIDGDILEVSFDVAASSRSYRSVSEGESFHTYHVPIRIKTSTSDYRIAIMYYTDNLKNPDMVGISYIHIICGEQIDEKSTYHGAGSEIIGIVFDERDLRD